MKIDTNGIEYPYPLGMCSECGSVVSTNPYAVDVHEKFHELFKISVSSVPSSYYRVVSASVAYDKAVGALEDDIRGGN